MYSFYCRHFIFANATVSFKQLMSTYPGPLMLVSILVSELLPMDYSSIYNSRLNTRIMCFMQCPDPHFKKRHHKRRVLQKPLVDSILASLMPGGKVCLSIPIQRVFLKFYFGTSAHA